MNEQLYTLQRILDRVNHDLKHFDSWAEFYLENNPDGSDHIENTYQDLIKQAEELEQQIKDIQGGN